MPKPDKDTIRNNRPTELMKRDTEFFSQIFANQFKKTKRSCNTSKWEPSLGGKDGSPHAN